MGFTDVFDNAAIGAAWTTAGSVSEHDGALVASVSTLGETSMVSTALPALDNGAVIVELTGAPTAAEGARALFQLRPAALTDNYAVNIAAGALAIEGGSSLSRALPVGTRYLRMHGGAGRIALQTSTNGTTFVTQRVVAAPSFLAAGPTLQLGLTRTGATGTAIDVDFEGITQTTCGCTVAFTDSFDTLDTAKWTVTGTPSPTITGGQLRITGGTSNLRQLVSTSTFDMRTRVLEGRVTEFTATSNADIWFEITDGSEYFEMNHEGADLVVVENGTQIGSVVYNAAVHQRFAIAGSGGQIVFSAGPVDGALAEIVRTAQPSWMSAARIAIGIDEPGAQVAVVQVDEVTVTSATCPR